jgi:bifunctional DNA-binding transcriptional regulator/antitoxin component of YhaV-PrlF toxin-antitoxin module
MSFKLNAAQQKVFAEVFLEEYMSRGHGNMSKREVDVLIFKILHNDVEAFKGLTNHLIAMRLRTTPAKVKNLKYESLLRFPPEEEDVFTEEYFQKQLKKYFESPIIKVRKNDGWIYLQIDDPIVQDALKAIARNNKAIIDGSFNSDIIKISNEGYILILKELADKTKIAEAERLIKQEYKEKGIFTLSNLGDKAISGMVKKGIFEAPQKISELTNWILSSEGSEIVNNLSQYVS